MRIGYCRAPVESGSYKERKISMFSRRGLLKAIFGSSVGAMTRPVGALVEALTTRKVSNQVLSFVTAEQICDAKMFFIPFIQLMAPISVRGSFYGEGRLNSSA